MTGDLPFRADEGGLLIAVRLTPRSARDAVTGVETAADGRPHIAARVRAVPEKGAANAALERLIADWLDVAKASVSVVGGGTSRLKTVRVGGGPSELAARLMRRLGTGAPE